MTEIIASVFFDFGNNILNSFKNFVFNLIRIGRF